MRAGDRDTVDAFDQAVAAIPHVLQAQRLFGEPDYLLRVITADGRPYLQLTDERYDLIVVDAYRQPYIPFYLATREFFEAAREHLAEAGAAWGLGRTIHFSAWVARHKGEPVRAERLFRESIRILAPLEDRSTLCESQRGLAELLLAEGRVDEAERFALAARETVGPEDVTSLSTTASTLGLVRAAQGRDEEAEPLLREAFDIVSETEHRMQQRDALDALAQFLRERGREDEAAELATRRERVLAEAASTA